MQEEPAEQPAAPESPAARSEQASASSAGAEEPAEPEQLVILTDPVQIEPEPAVVPAASETNETLETPEAREEQLPQPVTDPSSEPARQTETGPASQPQDEPAGGSGGHKGDDNPGPVRQRFSTRYPWRRVRMTPQEGIKAPAAGILVWPAPASPFQQMLNQE